MLQRVLLAVVLVACYLAVDTSAQPAGVDCTALANAGDCDFYTQCVEAKFQCGSRGYPLGYGDKYCRQFENNIDCFNANGQDWVNGVKSCLMLAILNSAQYNSNTTTCDELQAFAFESHPSCYVDNGFCSDVLSSFTNLECLAVYVFDLSDFFNSLAFQQVYDTAILCSKPVVNSFLSLVPDWIIDATTFINKELLRTLEKLLGGCNSGLDIVFILDASTSVGFSNFGIIRTFVNDIISNFEIGDDKTHVGVIRFSSVATIVIPLGSLNTSTSLTNAVSNIIYTGGGTRTDLALFLLNSIAFSTARTSEGIPRVAIVFTDGKSNELDLTIVSAQAVHASGISVYSFGIGNADPIELDAIASDPSNVLYIESFSVDNFASQLVPLLTKTCTTPTIIDINNGFEAILAKDETRLLQYNYPEEGLTLKVEVQVGGLLVRGSFTVRNPTSLTADFSVEGDDEGIDYFVSPELSSSSTNVGGSSSRKRQASNSTSSTNVYLSLVGLQESNKFSLNTTFADTTSSGADLSAKILCLPWMLLMVVLVIMVQ